MGVELGVEIEDKIILMLEDIAKRRWRINRGWEREV